MSIVATWLLKRSRDDRKTQLAAALERSVCFGFFSFILEPQLTYFFFYLNRTTPSPMYEWQSQVTGLRFITCVQGHGI